MSLTVTHEMHLLLTHAMQMIRLRKGVSHVGEGRIERTHQFQGRDIDSTKRLSNPEKAKESKMNRQAIRNDISVQNANTKVEVISKRKRDGKVIECKIKIDPKLKHVKREKVMTEVLNEKKDFHCKSNLQVKIE